MRQDDERALMAQEPVRQTPDHESACNASSWSRFPDGLALSLVLALDWLASPRAET